MFGSWRRYRPSVGKAGAVVALAWGAAGCSGPTLSEGPVPTIALTPASTARVAPECESPTLPPTETSSSNVPVKEPLPIDAIGMALPSRGQNVPTGHVASLIASAYQAATRIEHDGSLTVDPQWCASHTQTTEIAGCHVSSTALGGAAVVITSHHCAESCDLSVWYATANRPLSRLNAVQAEHVIVTPDLTAIVHDSWSLTNTGGYVVRLHHMSLASGVSTPGHECYAPALSPSGRWIVCRDVDGDVLRFPTGGGPTSKIHDAVARVYSNPHEGPYLSPVIWRSNGEIEILTVDASTGQHAVESTGWTE